MNKLNTLGDRLRYARRLAGLTQSELADRADVKQQIISKLESNKQFSTGYVVRFARACQVSSEWLDSGIGNPGIVQSAVKAAEPGTPYQTRETSKSLWSMFDDIPMVEWDNIKAFVDSRDRKKPKKAPKAEQISLEHLFKTVVADDAMTSASGFPTFPPGCTVLVDRAIRPKHLDFILVTFPPPRPTLLRQLVIRDSRRFLKPLKSGTRMVPMAVEAAPVGVVIKMLCDIM